MKKIFTIIIIIFAVFLIFQNKTYLLQKIIFIKGVIEINTNFEKKIKPNSILYITIKNDKEIIFAIKKIINPSFPLEFEINHKNVLYPDLITLRTKIQAYINTHGNVGEIKPGDIYSKPIDSSIINTNLKIYATEIKY